MWTFSRALLSFTALCSGQWVRCWLIFSEWLTNWPVWYIATASYGSIQYCHGNKALNLHHFFLKSWKDSFHLPEAKPTPSHLCLPLFLSLSPSLSDPTPPAKLSLLSDRPWQGLLRSKDRHIIRELKSAVPAPRGGMTVRHRPGAYLSLDCGNQRWCCEIWIEQDEILTECFFSPSSSINPAVRGEVKKLRAFWRINQWLKAKPFHRENVFLR